MAFGTILFVLLIFVAPVLFVVYSYNGLIRLKNRVKNGWGQIDVQLKRRYNLIPNLVEAVKGAMKHEQETLEKVMQARNQAMNAQNVNEHAQAENVLSSTLKSLFAVVENYPDLKANQNVLSLQEELSSTENKIAFSRQHYNDTVMQYNTRREVFPNNVIAGVFSFNNEDLFEVTQTEMREAPHVQLH